MILIAAIVNLQLPLIEFPKKLFVILQTYIDRKGKYLGHRKGIPILSLIITELKLEK